MQVDVRKHIGVIRGATSESLGETSANVDGIHTPTPTEAHPPECLLAYDPFMPDSEVGPETEQAPTMAAPDAPTAYSAEPETLDYDDPYPTEQAVPRSWGVAAGIAALVVVLGAVVAVLVWLVGQPAPNATVAIPTPPSRSVTVTPDASPSSAPTTIVETKTVTATPEAVPTTAETVAATPDLPEVIETPAVDLPTYDRLFVQRLRSMGWSIWDEGILTQNAHYACGRLRAGAPVELVNQEYVAGTGTGMMSATQFTAAAMAVYPNCP